MERTSSRCQGIIDLIDRCLAEHERAVRPVSPVDRQQAHDKEAVMGYLQLLEAMASHRRRQRERAAAIRDLIDERRSRARRPVLAEVRAVSRTGREWRR